LADDRRLDQHHRVVAQSTKLSRGDHHSEHERESYRLRCLLDEVGAVLHGHAEAITSWTGSGLVALIASMVVGKNRFAVRL
jgi:hypothetical protein